MFLSERPNLPDPALTGLWELSGEEELDRADQDAGQVQAQRYAAHRQRHLKSDHCQLTSKQIIVS